MPALGHLVAASLVTLLLLSSSCDDGRDVAPDVARRVSGIVRDGLDGERLTGVRVRFVSDTLDEATSKSDGDGRYRIAVLSDTDKGRLEASRQGYATRVVSVYFDSTDVKLDIELSRASERE